MKGPPIYLSLLQAERVLSQFQETARFRGWTLTAVAIMANHYHLVVDVPDEADPARVLADFKAYASRALNNEFGKPESDTLWTSKGSTRKLKDLLAKQNAIRYVVERQSNPLVVWSSERGRVV
jgi:REP element-mobilizing transposase RayT